MIAIRQISAIREKQFMQKELILSKQIHNQKMKLQNRNAEMMQQQ